MELLTLGTATLLRALHERDAYTLGHCDRAALLAVEVGRRLGLSSLELSQLRWAAELHDVGKIGIPDHVLLKPGALTADEMVVMRTHAQKSHDILMAIPDPAIVPIALAVRSHHEAIDGGGYPYGLKGEDIPILARIVSVVDVYDAMTTRRAYHEAKSHAVVMDLIHQGEGTRFDPAVVRALASIPPTTQLPYA